MLASRREFLESLAATGLVSAASCAAADVDVLTPEAFGARGDGRTNDTDAFAALSAHVNARGGGTIVFRPTTYIVGRDARAIVGGPPGAFVPVTILHFIDCAGPIVIRGNGAVLRCAPAMRFGMFDPRTGRPTAQKSRPGPASSPHRPYAAMICAERCSGLVGIGDLELDGNLPNHRVGGQTMKDGWQLRSSGIVLVDNRGPERLSNIHTHHHAVDGLTIYRPVGHAAASTTATDVRSEFNGRQGCSITGGRNFSFERCRFSRTGKGGLRSNPGSGVDVEAGRHPIRNVAFLSCEFSNNSGPGVLADRGDTEGVTFDGCRFVGTTSRSAWPNKPRMRFTRCLFLGSIVRAYGDSDPLRAAQFHDCRFSDDPALSPTGQVFGGRRRIDPVAMLPNNPNVLFNRCSFELSNELVLPFSTSAVIYSDCTMSQRAPQRSRPRGTYLGTSRISGNADLTGSIIRGQVYLNGRLVPPTA